jgi:hypothetical protein
MRPESRVGPRQEIPDNPLRKYSLLQEYPERLVSEEPRQRF